MKKRSIWSGAALAAVISLSMAAPASAKEMTIPDGIFVGDIELGGMTKEEAGQTIQDYVNTLADRKVTLTIEGTPVETTAGELGFAWTNPEAVEEAASHGTGGNLIQQYMERKDLEKEPVHLSLETGVDGTEFAEFVNANCQGMTAEPQNAAITRVDGRFEITPEVDGKTVDTEATKTALETALADTDAGEVAVEAAVTGKEAEIREEQLATIQDELGSFSTDFSSSGASRAGNLKNGAAKINGHVLMPGETLSGYECMHPFTKENGYFSAAAYENGRVVDSIGGGVCQISTTLYQAALRAELEIVQRQNHSMIVGYVKPSMDAATAGTVKDLKVTNNYSTPIYVEGYTKDRTLTFTIYGKETRPANRTVEFVSETLSTIDPGEPEVKVDNSLAPGTRKQVQSAHTGIKSRLWKVVKVDGIETERIILHTDTYNASKAIVLAGPEAPASAPAETAPAAGGQDESAGEAPSEESSIVEGIHGGPGVSSGEEAAGSSGGPGEVSAPAEAAGPAEEAPAPAAGPAEEAPAPAGGPGETEAPVQ